MEQARIEHAPNGSLLTYISSADALVNNCTLNILVKRVFINLSMERRWSMIFDFVFLLIVKNKYNVLGLNKLCAGCLVMIV